MLEIHKFKCELCGSEFDTIEQANEHEKDCSLKNVPIKAIVLYDNDDKIMIMNYPDAKYWKDKNITRCKVNLMPTKRCEECNYFYPALQFKFDTIKCIEGNLIIYTMNFDKEYEKSCIKNLFRYRKKHFENYLIYIKNRITKLENISKNINDVNIDVKENMFVENLDM